MRRFQTAPDSDFTETLAVNLEAPILLTRAVVPGMLARKRGHVVNIASGVGKVGVAYGTSYCASKHGLVGFTHALRAEYEKSPVGFSVVCKRVTIDELTDLVDSPLRAALALSTGNGPEFVPAVIRSGDHIEVGVDRATFDGSNVPDRATLVVDDGRYWSPTLPLRRSLSATSARIHASPCCWMASAPGTLTWRSACAESPRLTRGCRRAGRSSGSQPSTTSSGGTRLRAA